MTKNRFLARRQPDWYRFERLLDQAEGSRVTKQSGQDLSEFSRLFRALCADLATVRSRDWGDELERNLNDLVVRGHNFFYRAPPGKPRALLRFLAGGFPALLRANWAYFLVALVLFLGPGLVTGVLTRLDPEFAARVIPRERLADYDEMYSQLPRDRGSHRAEAGMMGFYVYNNVGIAFKCFALGILFGLGTALVLVFNGIALGTVSGYLLARGHSEAFLSFVISHGAFELTAIVISGAAGLILGHALVHPGAYSRLESLRRRGVDAVKLAAGAGVMLGVAALIEGFWSPSPVDPEIKYAVGSMLWAAVFTYLLLAGRRTEP